MTYQKHILISQFSYVLNTVNLEMCQIMEDNIFLISNNY